MREDIWVDELNFESYQNNEIDFIDDSGKSCCVHSLADHDKQVRKEVCDKIRMICNRNYNYVGDGTGYDGIDYHEMIGANNMIDKLLLALNKIQGE